MTDATVIKTPEQVELLAPGGSVDAIKAALLAGADAVYCGVPGFNARQRADNIEPHQLRHLATLAHQYSCRLYLTLNTLVCDNEVDSVIALAARAHADGVDAVIVQDFGLLYLLRTLLPEVELHASTQMTTHNGAQLALLSRAGVGQVNFCRELSLDELGSLCPQAREHGIKSEVFVHGAYCISFSGQCYMSSVMSGRSGNRGACVQPCRRNYSWDRGRSRGTPLNLKDNSAFRFAQPLSCAGVDSFKIEGRIKGYKYVYTTVAAWRRQINRLSSGRDGEEDDRSLRSVFNRSLSAGYLDGSVGRDMFIDTSRDQSLIPVATIRSYTADTGVLKLEREIRIDPETPVLIYGDGFSFVCTGFLIENVERFSYRLKITHKLKGKILSGQVLYRQADYDGPEDLRIRIDAMEVAKKALQLQCTGSVGEPLTVRFSDGAQTVTVQSVKLLTAAASQPLDAAILQKKLGMLGESPYTLDVCDCSGLAPGLFLPLKEVNDIRRRGVAQLGPRQQKYHPSVVIPLIEKPCHCAGTVAPQLALLVDCEEDALLHCAPETRLFMELPVHHSDYVNHFSSLFSRHSGLLPWFPAILPESYAADAVTLLERLSPERCITDNSGIGWQAAQRGIPWIAGPLLNATNSFTLKAYQHYANCSGAFISHELSREQMCAVVAPSGFQRWYTLFAPLLLMNTRQCIIRNLTSCTRATVDGQCLVSCERTLPISDDKNGVFTVVKRRGFYNQVYNHRNYFNLLLPNHVVKDGAVFCVDLRRIAGKTELNCTRQELVQLFEQFVAGAVPATALREVIMHTTAAQYTRGI